MTASVAIVPLTSENAAQVTAASPTLGAAVPTWLELVGDGISTLLIALIGEEVAGVVELRNGHVPEIRNLGVLEPYRGRGIGTLLLGAAEEASGPAPVVRMGVGQENSRARRLYGRLGYRGTGELETTTYDFVDQDGARRTATETDEWLEKSLSPHRS